MPSVRLLLFCLAAFCVVYFLLPHNIKESRPISGLPALSAPVALWFCGLIFYAFFSMQPDGYAIQNNLKPTPVKDLFVVLGLSTLECIFLACVATFGPRRSSLKALTLLLVFGPWAVFWVISSMHAAPVFSAHAIWQLIVVAGLVISLVTSIWQKN